MTCPDRPHVHQQPPVVVVFAGWTVVVGHDRSAPLLLCAERVVAERVAELLDRHGLVDVPDTPAAAVCPWPPPNPGGTS
jgi:hypothetical protein